MNRPGGKFRDQIGIPAGSLSSVIAMRKIASGALAAAAAVLLASCSRAGDEEANRPCEGPGTGGPRVVYRPEPTPDAPRVTRAAVEQTIEVMCHRTRELGSRGARIRSLHGDRIGVRLGPGTDASQTAVALGIPARLAFYDWDGNVIGNPDQPLTDLMRAVHRAEAARPQAEADDLPPGGAERSTVDRYHGDERRIRVFYDRRNDAVGPTYYAAAGGRIVAGPETSCAGLAVALGRAPRGESAAGDLDAAACGRRLAGRGLPAGGSVHVVPRGIRVVAAARPGGGAAGSERDELTGRPPEQPAGWYVIEDDAGVRPDAVEKATERTDKTTGATGVLVDFTADGATAFRSLTQAIVDRGVDAPSRGDPRLAVALDDQLVSLAAIDPVANPGGLNPEDGALIGNLGGAGRARLLAKLLDAGALPLNVRPAP
jgi:preprotein translocase subunit SecD